MPGLIQRNQPTVFETPTIAIPQFFDDAYVDNQTTRPSSTDYGLASTYANPAPIDYSFLEKRIEPILNPIQNQTTVKQPIAASVVDTNTSFRDAPTMGALGGDIYIRTSKVNGKRYNPYTKLSGTQATRNNNPGNISGMGGKLLYGAKRIARSGTRDAGDQKQLVFDNSRDGWRAMYSLMRGDKYNNAPIRKAFAKYQSDQAAFGRILNEMSSRGINIDNVFNNLPLDQKVEFMRIRAAHEGYRGKRLTADMLR